MMYVGVEPLQIFDVTVNDRVMMERNRVNIQRLIRAVMDQFSCAFMLFHYEDDTRWDWRFTYCRKSGNKEETTDSKRYTFLLGPGQSCRTATDNFMALYDKRNSLEIKDIENAFNVEALSKEFFGKYKAQYEDFVNYMVAPANGMRQHFIDTDFDHTGMTADKIRDREEKPIRDYVKKLLGRIVFLHFLQKKGWLGVPAGKEWGEGDRDFMLNIFKNANESQKENFLDDILEDLFAEGLDRNRSDQGDLYDTKVEGFRNCRIPYLNGGLFERDILDKKPSHFPASYFNSLLTMLSQYNFTIDENDPNDAEVGVDPEMLGRIFENLLEDNKDKGAFYTPKEIVQYMCRESLIAYLQTDMREEDKECIRQFVTTHDASLLGELKEYIDQKLCNVKICDPAIGSGAFPMGLLRELFFCRSAIEPNIIENAANIKRHIIQNNIYGVDIERGAVDIARLRFWLSLIVDEKSPEALPNLDFKIMQGNSLLEQYKGADLSTMTEKKVGSEHSITLFDTMLDVYRKNLRDKLAEYYVCPEHDKKAQLRKDIADIVKQELIEQGIHIDFEDMDLSANSQFFLWHTWFHDVFSRPILRGRDIKRYGYDWAGQWLIYIPWHFPYQFDESITGASEKAEKAFKEQYPAVYNHMLEYKEPLSKRNKAETGIRYEWYAMQRWGAKYWEDFSKPKIIWGEISDKSKFAFDFLGEYIPEATSFYMKGECIEYLLSALNSSVSEWLFSKVGTTTGVGTIRWKKYTIEQLIVAKLSTEQLNTHLAAFNDLKVGKMSITDFECFSNKLMYDVYKLTSDEIQYIENQQIV